MSVNSVSDFDNFFVLEGLSPLHSELEEKISLQLFPTHPTSLLDSTDLKEQYGEKLPVTLINRINKVIKLNEIHAISLGHIGSRVYNRASLFVTNVFKLAFVFPGFLIVDLLFKKTFFKNELYFSLENIKKSLTIVTEENLNQAKTEANLQQTEMNGLREFLDEVIKENQWCGIENEKVAQFFRSTNECWNSTEDCGLSSDEDFDNFIDREPLNETHIQRDKMLFEINEKELQQLIAFAAAIRG